MRRRGRLCISSCSELIEPITSCELTTEAQVAIGTDVVIALQYGQRLIELTDE